MGQVRGRGLSSQALWGPILPAREVPTSPEAPRTFPGATPRRHYCRDHWSLLIELSCLSPPPGGSGWVGRSSLLLTSLASLRPVPVPP